MNKNVKYRFDTKYVLNHIQSGICKDWYSLLEGIKTELHQFISISDEKSAMLFQQSDISDLISEDSFMNPLTFLKNPEMVAAPVFEQELFVESDSLVSSHENSNFQESEVTNAHKTISENPVDSDAEKYHDNCFENNYCDINADCIDEISGISCICKDKV